MLQTIEQIMRSDIGYVHMNLCGSWTDNILLPGSIVNQYGIVNYLKLNNYVRV